MLENSGQQLHYFIHTHHDLGVWGLEIEALE